MNNEVSNQFFDEYGLMPIQSNLVKDDEMSLSEHIEEFSQRLIFGLILLTIATFSCFTDIKEIVKVFEAPAIGIKFLQFAPGEYFFCIGKDCFFLWFINQ
jgi:sec-independent protein translocase protein TatC